LSAFLIVRDRDSPDRVVLGKMNPDAPWEHLAGIDPSRMERFRNSWVLPASQLLWYESPAHAANRVAEELLELHPAALEGPRVESEAYGRPDLPGGDLHWDLHFIFQTAVPATEVRPNGNWTELRFIRVSEVPRAMIGRGHADILDFLGLEAR
jgi:hypothetical protein